PESRAKAMEGAQDLEMQAPKDSPACGGAERTDSDGGNWGGPPRPSDLRISWLSHRSGALYNRTPGSESHAGRESEVVVVLIEPSGQHNRR
ncbi:MAG: hypothetical protein LC799_30965, partial [Actinobacteria bacterium]|nr:hypothetical protein [Actinomycetota bacterium]